LRNKQNAQQERTVFSFLERIRRRRKKHKGALPVPEQAAGRVKRKASDKLLFSIL
jgi:hypothetical protein